MKNVHFICDTPFKQVEIHSDGRACPCCQSWIDSYSYGTIFLPGRSFEQVWNSESAKEFRRSVLSGEYKYCHLEMCSSGKHLSETLARELGVQDDGTVLKYPKHVRFSHDQTCNVQCVTCREKMLHNSPERTKLLNSIIETKFLPVMKDAEEVSMNGEGEFFASAHGRYLARYIAEKYPNVKFSISTNGILCDEKHLRELGIIDRISKVQISIHAATENTYNQVVRGGNFDRVQKNIEWLVQEKNRGRIDKITIAFVVSSINFREMKAFLQQAIDRGIHASFWEVRPWSGSKISQSEEYAVHLPQHKDYNELAEILQDTIFDSPSCIMNGVLLNVRNSKNRNCK